jgi:hypothetical protein
VLSGLPGPPGGGRRDDAVQAQIDDKLPVVNATLIERPHPEPVAGHHLVSPDRLQAQILFFMFASWQIHPTAVDPIVTIISHVPVHHDGTPNNLSRAQSGHPS